jgi:iduronate 2-sulfatase
LASDSACAAVIAEHQKWLPQTDALPVGTTEWKPDKLDRRVEEWRANDSVPDWLK